MREGIDWQAAFDAIGSVFLVATGWFLAMLHGDMKDIKEKFAELPDTYARRDDFRDLMKEIREGFDKLNDKLDGKADK